MTEVSAPFRVGNVKRAGMALLAACVLWASAVPVQGVERDPRWRTGGDSRACSAPIWPESSPGKGPGNGKRVLVIGDSLTRNSAEMLRVSLRKSGWVPTIRCFGGKRIDWAIDQLRDQKSWKGIPKTVIIAMGTNDMRWIDRGITSQRIDKILDRLGPQREVMWINTFGGNGDRFSKEKQAWFNTTLDRKSAKRPNVVVMPWDRIARLGDVRLSSPLHYTYPGYRLRTVETVRLLNREFGKFPLAPPAFESTPPAVPAAGQHAEN